MSSRFADRIIKHLSSDSYKPETVAQIADDLRIEEDDRDEFAGTIGRLQEEGKLTVHQKGHVFLPSFKEGDTVFGSFRKNERGFGFVIPDHKFAEGDLFVPPQATADAMTGDTVEVRVHMDRRRAGGDRSPYTAEVMRVISRRRNTFAGTVRKKGGQWVVEPDGKQLGQLVVVRDAESKNAHEGSKVIVEIIHFPEGDYLAEGVISKVLGEAGEPDVETQAVIEAYGLPGEFPEACVQQARDATAQYDAEMKHAIDEGHGFDPAERLDMRDTYVLTIDPPDAKDYDDALSIEPLKDCHGSGPGWTLGVHIADVSHFIPPGSPLDLEARERGNSVYLPRLVIPMLPEILSNGICSLQERVPRYCKSAFIDYDAKGNVRATRFASTVIFSNKRLEYVEAQALIDGDENKARKHARTDPNYTPELIEKLRAFDKLSKVIRERRHKAGMIHLDLPDVELIFDDDGRVIDAVPEDDSYTHTLIEMFMVEANEAVARLFEDLEVPLLRRTHPTPVPGDSEGLQDFVRVAGLRIPKNPDRFELQSILDSTAGTPAAPAIHMAVLRTLTRAEYSPSLIGHFALASEAYAHFTSPIRRYPDLTVHRALLAFLERTDNGKSPPRGEKAKKNLGRDLRDDNLCEDEESLRAVAGNCNAKEENATQAERELRAFLVLQLLEQHIGEEFPAIVTGVTPKGVFIRLDKYLAEGLCKAEDLPDPGQKAGGGKGFYNKALWKIDRKTGALVEQNSGRSFNIGDRVVVRIGQIDLPRRQMDLVIADARSRDKGKTKQTANLAEGLKIGVVEEDKPRKTGAEKRSQRSKSRDKRKSDHRSDRKDKGKRQ